MIDYLEIIEHCLRHFVVSQMDRCLSKLEKCINNLTLREDENDAREQQASRSGTRPVGPPQNLRYLIGFDRTNTCVIQPTEGGRGIECVFM